MENLTIEEIITAAEGELIVKGNREVFKAVEIDTRKLSQDVIYIAIKGENFNGNDFVIEAVEKGANLCIVDEVKFDIDAVKEKAFVIKVNNTKKAMLSLAHYYLKKLNIKVIGVTGSTGKTSTKDLIAAALSEKFKVFKTIGNFNNDIGLPLMVFKLDKSYEVAILEMGMSNFGEIELLSETAAPDIAVITNVGISHIENLKSRENILKAKLEILKGLKDDGTLIVNNDNDLLSNNIDDNHNIIRIGTGDNCDIKAVDFKLNENSISFLVEGKKEKKLFSLNIPGFHNVLNSMLAIACGELLGVSYDEMAKGFNNLQSTSMRLDFVEFEKYKLINDAYNASPDSMKAAIDVLSVQGSGRKVCVLGTMKELGDESYKAHREVGAYAKGKNIDCLIVTGEFKEGYIDGFDNVKKTKSFENIDEIIGYLKENIQENDIILIKASRSMKFERILEGLKQFS